MQITLEDLRRLITEQIQGGDAAVSAPEELPDFEDDLERAQAERDQQMARIPKNLSRKEKMQWALIVEFLSSYDPETKKYDWPTPTELRGLGLTRKDLAHAKTAGNVERWWLDHLNRLLDKHIKKTTAVRRSRKKKVAKQTEAAEAASRAFNEAMARVNWLKAASDGKVGIGFLPSPPASPSGGHANPFYDPQNKLSFPDNQLRLLRTILNNLGVIKYDGEISRFPWRTGERRTAGRCAVFSGEGTTHSEDPESYFEEPFHVGFKPWYTQGRAIEPGAPEECHQHPIGTKAKQERARCMARRREAAKTRPKKYWMRDKCWTKIPPPDTAVCALMIWIMSGGYSILVSAGREGMKALGPGADPKSLLAPEPGDTARLSLTTPPPPSQKKWAPGDPGTPYESVPKLKRTKEPAAEKINESRYMYQKALRNVKKGVRCWPFYTIWLPPDNYTPGSTEGRGVEKERKYYSPAERQRRAEESKKADWWGAGGAALDALSLTWTAVEYVALGAIQWGIEQKEKCEEKYGEEGCASAQDYSDAYGGAP